MKKILIIVGISVIALILVAAVFVYSLFAFLKKEQNKEFYVLGNDSISSYTYVLGEKRLSGFSFEKSNGEETRRYNYRSESSMEEGKKYTQYLVESEGFEKITTAQGGICYQKQSEDTSMLLTVTVVVSNESVSVSIYKKKELSFVSTSLFKRLCA